MKNTQSSAIYVSTTLETPSEEVWCQSSNCTKTKKCGTQKQT